MTIDEAIKHCVEVMMENLEKTKDRNASDPIVINCFECADEHRQLAEWLKDYKRLLGAIDAIKAEIAEYLQAEGFGSEYRNNVAQIVDRHISGGDTE